ncbi:MAG: sensor histidine kinase, partial [Chloroflexi bacterium]|nr:sensor histidine kinase [Chloroflexota bacterium]
EEERQHLARELHDELGQALTAMTLNLAEVERNLPSELAPVLREKLAETRSLVDETLNQVRQLALDLRPSILDDLGLGAALRWYTNRYVQRLDVDVQLEVTGLQERLAPAVETTLYRVAQEALTNIARHAQASRVRLHLARQASAVVLLIQDDGRGFDVAEVVAPTASGSGAGLMGMSERAALLGGTLDIQSRPGQGTRLLIEIPLPGREGA